MKLNHLHLTVTDVRCPLSGVRGPVRRRMGMVLPHANEVLYGQASVSTLPPDPGQPTPDSGQPTSPVMLS